MALDAAEWFAKVLHRRSDNDPGVVTTRALPLSIEMREVRAVERQHGSALSRGIGKLLVVGQALVSATGFLAALCIVATVPQRPGQVSVDVLVGKDSDPQPGHGRPWIGTFLSMISAQARSFLLMSSSTRAGCCA